MKISKHGNPALLLRSSITLLPCLLIIVAVLGSAQVAFAQSPLTFTIPHEIQRSALLVIDLDGDGKKEIITGSIDGYVTVVDGASYDVIWDKNIGDYLKPKYSKTRIQAGLAAADLDHNGTLELVIATGGADPLDAGGPGAIVVLTYVGGRIKFQPLAGWPQFALDELGRGTSPDGVPDGFMSTPSLGDIDGDGYLEIVIGGMDRRLHAYKYTGSELPGWPLGRNYDIYRESRSTAALADLDNDGVLDIIIGSNNYKIPNCANPYLFYALKSNTVALPGFPYQTTQNIESSPAIADINHDGSLDIVFGTGDFNEDCGQPSNGKKVYALDRFGKPLPGWPVATNANILNSPALGDLDNDEQPEVVVHTQDTLYAWHGDGTPLQGFPVRLPDGYNYRYASPVLADVDGDSQVEIVLASGQVYGPTGKLEQQREKLQSQVVVTDQDGDGLLETIGANHFNYEQGLHLVVYIFQESGSASGAQPWPMFHRTIDRTGVVPILYRLNGQIIDEAGSGVPRIEVTLNSGQATRTDAKGNYHFDDLPPGNYVVTPSAPPRYFDPAQRSLTLAGDATADFVIHEPFYDVQGNVLQANNAPLAGVTLQLNTGAAVTTDDEGAFSFDDQPPGEYTLTPVSPELSYLPAEGTLTAEERLPQLFYALPLPVTQILGVGSTMEVDFFDTQGLPTRILFPDAVSGEEALVTPLLPEALSDYMPAGHSFAIALPTLNGQGEASATVVDATPLAFTIEIQYSEADLQARVDADQLLLLWKSDAGWVDVRTTCPNQVTFDNNLELKTVTVRVCQLGTYGLFAPVGQLYLPSVMAGEP